MSHSSFLCNDPSVFAASHAFDPSLALAQETPFHDAEAAWFWCVRISDAIHSGAGLRSHNAAGHNTGQMMTNSSWGSAKRPCEAVDIQKVVLRLSRENILTDRHIHVMSLYGKRRLRPAANSSARLYWQQAMNHLTPVLQRKGIVAL